MRARSVDCQCDARTTCRACLSAAGPTPGEPRTPHDEGAFLAGVEQHAFEQARAKGPRYAAERMHAAQDGMCSLHAANRRYWEAVARGTERGQP